MDLLYSIGPDNGSDFYNLRMSLRSVDRYAKNVGKVIVAGHIPDWITKEVIAFPFPKDKALGKHWNILNTVFAVIDAGLVQGEFLYSSDDHFLVRPVDFDKFPYYYKRDTIRGFDEVVAEEGLVGWAGYNKSVGLTRKLLEENGYGIRQYNGHVNTHFDTRDASAVQELIAKSPRPKVGYEPTCLFMNVRDRRCPVVPTYREDCKLSCFDEERRVWEYIGGRDTFSVCDQTDLGENLSKFKGFMNAVFTQKSRFEKP